MVTIMSALQPADLLETLRAPSLGMRGLGALKTRYRPLVCPLECVLMEIPEGARLFDIGCGAGALMYLALRLRGARVAHGYDISARAIAGAAAFAKGQPGFRAELRGSTDLPSLAGYDTIALVDVLHHVPPAAQAEFLRGIVAGMDPGARLILLDINADRVLTRTCNQLHDLLLARERVHPMRPAAVAGILRAAGARLGETRLTRRLWYGHYLIVAAKPG